MTQKRIKLKILGITFSQVQAGAYALIMSETEGARRIPIIIGSAEAQSIAIYLEDLKPPRPLTHDLFMNYIEQTGMKIKESFIHGFVDGVFYADILFSDGKREIRLDARTSDAIALAVRANADIYTTEEIMREVAIEIECDFDDLDEPEFQEEQSESLEQMNVKELQFFLDEAIDKEDYEKASYIKDLIDKKSGGE